MPRSSSIFAVLVGERLAAAHVPDHQRPALATVALQVRHAGLDQRASRAGPRRVVGASAAGSSGNCGQRASSAWACCIANTAHNAASSDRTFMVDSPRIDVSFSPCPSRTAPGAGACGPGERDGFFLPRTDCCRYGTPPAPECRASAASSRIAARDSADTGRHVLVWLPWITQRGLRPPGEHSAA